MACFADINVSQSSVATCERCGGMFNIRLAVNLLGNLPVKKIVNSLRFDRITVSSLLPRFLAHPVHSSNEPMWTLAGLWSWWQHHKHCRGYYYYYYYYYHYCLLATRDETDKPIKMPTQSKPMNNVLGASPDPFRIRGTSGGHTCLGMPRLAGSRHYY